MELKSLRRADFISSIIVLLFGIFIIVMAFRMPMSASYGGVENFWYIAPALFPLFIGGAFILMGTVLCITAVKEGGLKELIASLGKGREKADQEKRIRTLIVMYALGSFIYVLIPNIDFVVSIATFLFFLCATFYSESALLFRILSRWYIAGTLLLGFLLWSGMSAVLVSFYPYALDLLVILFLAGMVIVSLRVIKKEGQPAKKIYTVLWVSILVPMILCPIFRYALLTPLPNEGIIIDHMNWIYFSLKYRR
jgi:hypothetical protein